MMDRVQHFDPSSPMTVHDFVNAMKGVGVLGAGRLGRASSIVQRIFEDPKCFTFLSMSGPMVPGGLRTTIVDLIRNGHIDAIVTSGANIVHDLVEAYGGAHFRVPENMDDHELRSRGMGRIADIYVGEKDFEVFEKKIYEFLDDL
ncbi:MAG: deoxyhypusine synthase family protein, partial [Candidatus Thorarchaeota archaeon]